MVNDWYKLRSDIYIRDKGICWICNEFVDLRDYDLGHLIDKCCGGISDYDNLVVMHNRCNHIKPIHQTLDSAIKWKLTYQLPKVNKNNYPNVNINYKTTKNKISQDEQISKILPATICWTQGHPMSLGGIKRPMWKILPPPYSQDCLFSIRFTPPNAKYIENGTAHDNFQVLNGILEKDVEISVGITKYNFYANNGNPYMKISLTNKANKIIGNGLNQIPINTWRQAKKQGLTLKDLIDNHNAIFPQLSLTN